jgi:hypothetical protein
VTAYGFNRLPDSCLQDRSFRPTGHKAQKIRVTGYLLWDDEHNGSADVGSTIQYFSKNGFHHPWRSTAWEIHPVMKIEVILSPGHFLNVHKIRVDSDNKR